MNRGPSERWREVDALFAAALELPQGERRSFLDEACGGNPEAQRYVERLLAAHLRSESFLEHRTEELGAALASRTPCDTGQRLGAYRLEERIGEGGMGAVYLARRGDHQFEQQVAIKVMHATADGDLRRRFESERQILARLQHPNIARLYDGGVTDDGRPYLVMEHVDGFPIDRWCDRHALLVARRLELVIKVCRAVSYAHRNLLVHRDLKPANILVGADSEPKLLDFGIARLLGSDGLPLGDGLTRTGVRPMSPAYASPEQVRGEPVTTASDVYSLGVLLFELLTGESPYLLEADLPHELERAVLEQDPRVASETVLPQRVGRDAGEVARARGTTSAELSRRLAGDLDNILAMALRKQPERRYGSARELAADLERHLALRPVQARPDTLGYRLGKFVRRNRLAVAAASTLFLFSIAFASITAAMALRIPRERDTAEHERSKAKAVSEFLNELFEQSDPAGLSGPRGGSLTVREVLDRGVARIERLEDQPELKAAHLTTMGKGYRGLGLFDEAAPLLEEAVALRQEAVEESPLDLAASLNELGTLRQDQGDFEPARALFEEALELRRAHLGPWHEDLAQSLNNLALLLYRQDDFGSAEQLYREALPIVRSLGDDSLETTTVLNNLAIILHARGDYEGAEPLYSEVLALRRRLLPADHPWIASSLNNLGTLLRDGGDLVGARPLLLEALEIDRVLGERHPAVVPPLRNLALLAFLEGDAQESERLFREALSIAREVDPEHPMVARMLTGVARARIASGDFAAAEAQLEEALEIFRAKLPESHWRTAYAKALLAACWGRRGELDRAESVLRASYEAIEAKLGPREPRPRDVAHLLAEHYEARGRLEEAARYRVLASLPEESHGSQN